MLLCLLLAPNTTSDRRLASCAAERIRKHIQFKLFKALSATILNHPTTTPHPDNNYCPYDIVKCARGAP